MSTTRDGKIKL